MPDNDKQLKGREKREAKRDAKLEQKLATEAKKYGVSFDDIPSRPTTQETKTQVGKGVKGLSPDYSDEDIQAYSKSYTDPEYAKRTGLDKEQLKQSIRKQKRAKVGDILVGVLKGMSGERIDPSQFKATRIKKEREAQYQQYKDIAAANKATHKQFEGAYRGDLINYLDEKIASKNTSETERLKAEKLKAEIEKTKADTAKANRYKPSSGTQPLKLNEGEFSLKGSNPYHRAITSLTDNVAELIPGYEEMSASDRETNAMEIINQMYDVKTDSNGNQYLAPREGAEGYMDEVRTNVQNQELIKPIDLNLKIAEQELQQMKDDNQGTSWYEFSDKATVKELKQRIADLKLQKQEILRGGSNSTDPWNL